MLLMSVNRICIQRDRLAHNFLRFYQHFCDFDAMLSLNKPLDVEIL